MKNTNIVLPLSIDLNSVKLTAFAHCDQKFYLQIYSNEKLMKYINKQICPHKIRENFDTILSEHVKAHPQYISYIVKNNQEKMGVFGAKLHSQQEMEIGLILLEKLHGLGWSKKINISFMKYIQQQLGIHRFIAYCYLDNVVANSLFKSLSFEIQKQFLNIQKNQLMNKWILNKHST